MNIIHMFCAVPFCSVKKAKQQGLSLQAKKYEFIHKLLYFLGTILVDGQHFEIQY